MGAGAVASILDGMHQGADPTAGVVALSRAQAARTTELLVQMYALKAATEIQDAAALGLIQNAMGIGQNIDMLA